MSLFHHSVRASCGLEPHPDRLAVSSWLQEHSGSIAPGTEHDLPGVSFAELDLSVGSSGIPEATARGGDQEAMESQHQDFIVLEGAYHGNTSGLIDISPYKFEGPGGSGCPKHVHVAPTPDDYRGPFKRHEPRAGFEYARLLSGPIEQARTRGRVWLRSFVNRLNRNRERQRPEKNRDLPSLTVGAPF